MKGSSLSILMLGLFGFCSITNTWAQVPPIVFSDSLRDIFISNESIVAVHMRSTGTGNQPEMIVATQADSGSFHMLRGFVGDGYLTDEQTTLSLPQPYPSTRGVVFVSTDLEGDGDEDVIVYWNTYGSDLPEQFLRIRDDESLLVIEPIGQHLGLSAGERYYADPSMFDLDGDGDLEILLYGAVQGFSAPTAYPLNIALELDPTNEYRPIQPPFTFDFYRYHTDVNMDGLEDVFHYDQAVWGMYFNSGSGAFNFDENYSFDSSPGGNWRSYWYDFNEDGVLDRVHWNGTEDGLIQVSGSSITSASVGPLVELFNFPTLEGTDDFDLRVTDFNNDGRMDVLVRERLFASPALFAYTAVSGNSTWPSSEPPLVLVESTERNFLLSDLDGDGDQDLVVFDSGSVRWLENLSTSVGIEERDTNPLSLLPVPASTTMNVRLDRSIQQGRIHITDGLGRSILEQPWSGPNGSIDVSGMAPGLYHLQLTATYGFERHGRSFVVEH